MTIVTNCENDMDAHKIEANLYKLVNVIDVQDVTHQPNVTRDLALIKCRSDPNAAPKSTDSLKFSAPASWTWRLIP